METIEGIQQDLEELNAGQTRRIGDFVQEMQQKYDIRLKFPQLQKLRLNKPIAGIESIILNLLSAGFED